MTTTRLILLHLERPAWSYRGLDPTEPLGFPPARLRLPLVEAELEHQRYTRNQSSANHSLLLSAVPKVWTESEFFHRGGVSGWGEPVGGNVGCG